METQTPSKPTGPPNKIRRITLSLVISGLMVGVFYNMAPSYNVRTFNMVLKEHTEKATEIGQIIRYNEDITSPNIFRTEGPFSHMDILDQINASGYNCGDISQDTDLANSKMYINGVNETTGQVDVVIETYNHYGNRKSTGGDIIVIWAVENSPSADLTYQPRRIVGSVVDRMNGSYTGTLTFRWSGVYTVYTSVLSTYRTQCLRFKAMHRYGNSVFSLPNAYGITFTFKNGSRTDTTRCGATDYIYDYTELCDFTAFNYNYSYYCGKPDHGLSCSDYNAFNMRQYDLVKMNVRRSSKDIIYSPGWGRLAEQTVNISVKTKTNTDEHMPFCFTQPIADSWISSPSQVYIDNGRWRHASCSTRIQTETSVRRCLANKTMFFIGDSTIRQYVERIGSVINESLTYHPFYVTLLSKIDALNITWRKHELPFHNIAMQDPNDINSTANQIHEIANDVTLSDRDLILLFTYNTHLQAFPASVFRDRIKRLVKALEFLFVNKPNATVLYKGPNVTNVSYKWFDARISLLYTEILLEEFSSIKHKVRYLDVFTISVLNDNHDLHPLGVTLTNQLEQFLAYVCP